LSCRGRRSGRCQQDVLLLLRCRSHELLRGGQRGAAHLLSLRLLLLVVVVLLLRHNHQRGWRGGGWRAKQVPLQLLLLLLGLSDEHGCAWSGRRTQLLLLRLLLLLHVRQQCCCHGRLRCQLHLLRLHAHQRHCGTYDAANRRGKANRFTNEAGRSFFKKRRAT
jgi:hypothetical protein